MNFEVSLQTIFSEQIGHIGHISAFFSVFLSQVGVGGCVDKLLTVGFNEVANLINYTFTFSINRSYKLHYFRGCRHVLA